MNTIEQRVIEELLNSSDRVKIDLSDDLKSVLKKDCGIGLIQTLIEDEFEISISDEEMRKVKTVSDLARLVKSKMNLEVDFETVSEKTKKTENHPIKVKEKNSSKMIDTTNEFQNQQDSHKLACEILMQAAAPDIYQINAFRISGLNVSATIREISNQIQKNQMLEKYGNKIENHKSPFPIVPPPDYDRLRQALHRLRVQNPAKLTTFRR